MRSSWDKFGTFADMVAGELSYREHLEQEVRDLKKDRDHWRERAEPGWKDRELRAAIDGEISLLREQG